MDDSGPCCSPLASDPLGQDEAVDLARRFKALGDPARLRLLSLIASHEGGEACVCEISGVFDSERRGTWVYYRVVPAALARLSHLLDCADLTGARA